MNKENLKPPRPLKISYRDGKCLICETSYVTSLLINMQEKTFILCKNCARKLKEYLDE